MQEAVHAISVGEELARLRTALSAAGDVTYEWDLTADSIKWSGDVAKAFSIVDGRIPETAAAFEAIVAQEDHAARSNFVSRLKGGETQVECEYWLNLPSEGESWVHDQASAQFDDSGCAVRLAGILRFMDPDLSRAGHREHLANFAPPGGTL